MNLTSLVWMVLFHFAQFAITTAQEPAPPNEPVPAEQPAKPAQDAAPEPPAEPAPIEQPEEPKPEDSQPEEPPPASDAPPMEAQPAPEEKPAAVEPPIATKEIIPRNFLTLPAVGNYGKAAIHTDAIDAQIARGQWKTPTQGDAVSLPGGVERRWNERASSDTGILDTGELRGGYAVTSFDSPEDRVMILQASGHALVYINGEPRTGDIYGYGWVELPVLVREGTNELLFQTATDSLSVKLVEPSSNIYFHAADTTLPDLVEGEADEKWAAVPVVNATQETFAGHLTCSLSDGATLRSPLPAIPPLSIFKAPVRIPPKSAAAGEKVVIDLAIHAGPVPPQAEGSAPEAATATPEKLAQTQLTLDAVAAGALHSRTFRSEIDGSIQSYAVLPAGGEDPSWEGTPGIMLALHGAGVDARKHAASYKPKRWAHVVAPNNRRPYGFDWEDWGRIDALEALADAERRFPNDPLRRYVTGHSMGGHGAWHLGVTYPGRFAAIAPSAGWPSFWSYGGGMPHFDDPTPVEEMLLRSNSPSDTTALLGNLTPVGTYLLHGEKDDNVPVTQARLMRSKLADFHPDFAYYEQRDAGHWWGDECVDWPWMMQFLRNHKLPNPGGPPEIDFTTVNPGVSSKSHWAAIEAQQKPLEPSRIILDQTPGERRITGRTENVARLMLDLSHFPPGGNVRVRLDGTDSTRVRLPRGDDKRVWLARLDDRWRQIPPPPPRFKGPNRNGTFKAAFDNRVLLVYGTKGSPDENQWALAKARFDAETFWYRGNGAIEVVADTAFNADDDRDCNVILYGNSETNSAWPALLSLCPVQVRKGQVTMGLRPESGEELGVLFCWPRQGSDNALVGVVGGTGINGMRLTTRLRYFVSGVAYPDLMLFGPSVLTDGTGDIRAIGYFGNDWKIDSGEIVWRDLAL